MKILTQTHTASCFSSVMYTEGATAAGGSEVDGFAEGSGQVCFSEGLRHRLQDEDDEQRVDEEREEKDEEDEAAAMLGLHTKLISFVWLSVNCQYFSLYEFSADYVCAIGVS